MTPLPDEFLRRPVAHRAFHDVTAGRPENSRTAIEAAIACGYGVEIDLQLSRDGVAMVLHDHELSRLTDQQGRVRDRTASELENIRLIGNGEGIPGFDEVLTLVAGRVPLLTELKDQHGDMGETDGGLERAVAHALQDYEGPVALMSFNPNMVAALANLAPQRPRGLVTCGYEKTDWPELSTATRVYLREIPDFERTGSSFISHHVADLGRPRVTELRAQGVPVLCWTITSAEAEVNARQRSDNITFEGYAAEWPG